MAANFALALYPGNIGEQANQAFQQGQKTYRENTVRNAMSVLARDPTNKGALSALAQADPQTAMDFRKQQLEYAKTQLAQHQDSIIKGAEIWRSVKANNPNMPPEQQWQLALHTAAAAGLPMDGVPTTFTPDYANGLESIADAFKPQTGQQPRFVPFQQGGGVVRVNPDGTTSMVIQPNPGDQQPGAPVGGAPVTATGPNGEKIQLNPQTGQWEPMGGGASNGTGGFP